MWIKIQFYFIRKISLVFPKWSLFCCLINGFIFYCYWVQNKENSISLFFNLQRSLKSGIISRWVIQKMPCVVNFTMAKIKLFFTSASTQCKFHIWYSVLQRDRCFYFTCVYLIFKYCSLEMIILNISEDCFPLIS